MAHNVYVTAMEPGSGRSAVVLGLNPAAGQLADIVNTVAITAIQVQVSR